MKVCMLVVCISFGDRLWLGLVCGGKHLLGGFIEYIGASLFLLHIYSHVWWGQSIKLGTKNTFTTKYAEIYEDYYILCLCNLFLIYWVIFDIYLTLTGHLGGGKGGFIWQSLQYFTEMMELFSRIILHRWLNCLT